jgi:hypothetical protein
VIEHPPAPTCNATTKAGEPCRATPMPGQAVCWSHTDDPETLAAVHRGRTRGGHHRSTAKRTAAALHAGLADPLAASLAALLAALDGIEDGSTTPARAHAVASVSRALVAVWDCAQVEQRLDALEARMGVR